MMQFFAYQFVQNAYIAATMAAVVCGVIGYFLMLRREVFAGHAVAHAAFPGATGAALAGLSPVIGLTCFAVAAGLGISALGERAHRDVAIGIVLSFSLGLGLLFLHFYTDSAGNATALLFGNVLGIGRGAIAELAGMSALCLLALAVISRPLIFASLQPELAEAKGISLRVVSALFMVVLALAVAETIQIVGVLLVFALLVAPAAAATRLTRTVGSGIVLSVVIAVAIVWIGLLLAFETDFPTSFWITTLGALAYLTAQAAAYLHKPG